MTDKLNATVSQADQRTKDLHIAEVATGCAAVMEAVLSVARRRLL